MLRPILELLTRVCLALAVMMAVIAPHSATAQFLPTSSATPEAKDSGPAPDGQDTSPLETLLDVLRDEAARDALVAELERVTSEAAPADGATAAVEGILAAEPTPSIGTRIALITQSIAQTLAEQAEQVVHSFSGGGNLLGGLASLDVPVLWDTFQSLILVIIITVAVWLGLRAVLKPVFRRMGEQAKHANFLRTIFIFIGSTLLDGAVVVAAWALGYAITLLALGDYAQVGFRQALYLNAFLLVELVKVAIRAIISPTTGGLRLIHLSNSAAVRLNRHVNVVVSVLGYGQLLVVPLVNRNISYIAGLGISALLSAFVLVYLVVLVIRHRDTVATWISRRLMAQNVNDDPDLPAEDSALAVATQTPPEPERLGGILGTLTRTWHWFTLAYLGFMFVVVISRPADVVADYVFASSKVLAAALIGSLVVGAIGRAVKQGVQLPEDMRHTVPLLEPRLNALVPKVLIALRFLVLLGVAFYTLDIIGLLDLRAWFSSPIGLEASSRFISVVLILLVAALIWLATNSWIDYRLNPDVGKTPTSRETTLLTLLRNAITIALLVFTLMFVLAEIGLDIGPLLASAGVLGLAIGFGAQKLVQDIITGVFIQFDNAMNVGDVVTVGGTTGVVEKLTVRSVSLRDVHGTFHIIPFSSVDMVSNFMRDFSFFVCDMGIAYREDVEEAKQAMFDAFDELKLDPEQLPNIIGDLEWFGLNSFGDSAIVVRARIKTLPGKQWGLGRVYNGILKRIFDERGIEIPFPHQTIFFGEAKDGSTQAIRLKSVEEAVSDLNGEPSQNDA
jgi:moderate conductance mechanosensitive channel